MWRNVNHRASYFPIESERFRHRSAVIGGRQWPASQRTGRPRRNAGRRGTSRPPTCALGCFVVLSPFVVFARSSVHAFNSPHHRGRAPSIPTAIMPEEGRKRSRFDQTEPEPKRQSRFDRRSRSPSSRQSEARRSRSPLNRQNSDSPATQEKKDPAAAAAAAAARINAQIQARKGIQHVDVPPIRSTASPVTARSPSAADSGNGASGEVYQQDGDYIKDIEVNDLRNRYTLTKGSTQKMVNTSDHSLLILLGTCTSLPLHPSFLQVLVSFLHSASSQNILWEARRSSLTTAI